MSFVSVADIKQVQISTFQKMPTYRFIFSVLFSFFLSGCFYSGKVTVIDAQIYAIPTAVTTSSGYPVTFSASGGLAPYFFSVVSGPGSIDSSTGVFNAGGISRGLSTIRITDANGTSTTATVYSNPFNVNGQVNVIAQNGRDLYLGGSFTQITTAFSSPYLAKLDMNSGTPILTCDFREGFNSNISAVVYFKNSIFVGGAFTQYKGNSIGHLAKLDSNCNLDPTFDTSIGFNGIVNTIAVNQQNNSVYIGGGFTQYQGVSNSAKFFAKLDLTSGSLDTSFTINSSGFDNSVNAIAINPANNSVYVAGVFTQYRGVANNAQRLAKINLDNGNLDTTFTTPASGLNNTAWTLGINPGNNSLYVGGAFTQYRGIANNSQYLAKIDLTSGILDTSFTVAASGFNNPVYALKVNQSNNSLYVGGFFSQYRGVANNTQNLAKLDLTTGNLDSTFSLPGSGFNNTVNSLEISQTNNSLYVGGIFTQYRGVANNAQYLAKIDLTSGNLDSSFILPGRGFNNGVYTIIISQNDNSVYIGGSFNQYRGTTSNAQYLAKVDLTSGSLDSTFTQSGNGFNNTISVLQINSANNSIYVGGNFTQYRGVANNAQYLAKLDLNSGNLDSVFSLAGNGFNNQVSALALNLSNNSLYVGGSFTQYRGIANNAQYLAKLDLSSGNLDSTFTQSGNGFNSNILAIAVNNSNSSIYVGGSFSQYRGLANNAQMLAKLDLTSGALDSTFTLAGNGFNNPVLSIAINQDNNSLYVGGWFTQYRGVANNAQHLAKLDLNTGNLDSTFTQSGNGFNFFVFGLALNQANNSLYVCGQFSAYRGGTNNTQYIAKLDLTSGMLDPIFTLNNNGFNSSTYSLAVDQSSNTLFVGGYFNQYRGMYTTPYFISLDLDSGSVK